MQKKRAESLAVPVWPVTPEKNIQNRRLRRQFELLASLFWKKKRGAGGKFSDLWNIKAILKCFHGAFYEEGKSSILSKQKQLGLKSSMGGNVQPRLDSIPSWERPGLSEGCPKPALGSLWRKRRATINLTNWGCFGMNKRFPFCFYLEVQVAGVISLHRCFLFDSGVHRPYSCATVAFCFLWLFMNFLAECPHRDSRQIHPVALLSKQYCSGRLSWQWSSAD